MIKDIIFLSSSILFVGVFVGTICALLDNIKSKDKSGIAVFSSVVLILLIIVLICYEVFKGKFD